MEGNIPLVWRCCRALCRVMVVATLTFVGLLVEVPEASATSAPPGDIWTSRTPASSNIWRSVAYGGGLFVAVSSSGSGNRVMTSPDGITWTARTSAADNSWTSVAYGGGLFVAVANTGSGDRVMTSPDGFTWTARSSAADNSWRSVAYGGGLFVAVADSGSGDRVMTSPDGITWTARTSAADNSWTSVAFGGGLFVAVSSQGVVNTNRVMTSPDGITWTLGTSAPTRDWQSVTYGEGLFVAVGTSGIGDRVMTSPDGITWTSRTSATNSNWTSVTHGEGRFVAVANSGTANWVMTSEDGIAWTSRTPANNNCWQSVVFGAERFVAVGFTCASSSLVMTSGYTYTVTFDNNGGSGSMAAQSASSATALTTNSFSRTGYSFGGWCTAQPAAGGTCASVSGTSYANSASYPFTSSVTLYAVWAAVPYTVTFNNNGGSGSMAAQSASSATALTTNSFSRTGYSFGGWCTAQPAAGGTCASVSGTSYANSASYPFTSSVTLYAVWTANPLTVTYDADDGSAPSGGASSTVTGGTLSSLATTTRDGYTFDGWFTASSGGIQVTTSAGHGQTADFTLFARWTANPLTVTYDARGGSAPSGGASSTVTGGTLSSLATTTRDGYTFDGWFTASSGGIQVTTSAGHGQTADFTLFARWTATNPGTSVPPANTGSPSNQPAVVVAEPDRLPNTGAVPLGVVLTAMLMMFGGALLISLRRWATSAIR